MAEILWPFGLGDSQALAATGTAALTITDNFTYIDGVTVQATGNRTINLTISSSVKLGAQIFIASKTAATETTIFGTGFTNPTITGAAGKTKTQKLTYNGSVFLPDGTSIQID